MGGTDQILAGMICSPRPYCRLASGTSTDGRLDSNKGGSGLQARKLKAACLTERTLPWLQPCKAGGWEKGYVHHQMAGEQSNSRRKHETGRTASTMVGARGREVECVCRGDIQIRAQNITYVLQKRRHI